MVGTNRGLYDRKIKKGVHDPKFILLVIGPQTSSGKSSNNYDTKVMLSMVHTI